MKGIDSSSIIVCGIVRNAEIGLRRNIPVIKELVRHFRDYKIVIFENDSEDKTKQLLYKWKYEDRDSVYVSIEDKEIGRTIPSPSSLKWNPFYCKNRISKMADLRNQYVDFIGERKWDADYMMVVDLDVAHIDLKGILSSFGDKYSWDAITAFGYSTSPRLRRRYHDAYALTLLSQQDVPQTEQMIRKNSYALGGLTKDSEWIRVYSAFGGLAIYRFEAVKGLRYKVIRNDDPRVEVRCEHYSICKQMIARGYDKIYINPNMTLKYQDLTWEIILNSLKRRLRIQ